MFTAKLMLVVMGLVVAGILVLSFEMNLRNAWNTPWLTQGRLCGNSRSRPRRRKAHSAKWRLGSRGIHLADLSKVCIWLGGLVVVIGGLIRLS